MGAIAEVCHDERGVIWPETVAPFQAHLIAISGQAGAEIKKSADAVYKNLKDSGMEVLYDDRRGLSAGEKFADADLIGTPWRIVVSDQTLAKQKVEIKKRNDEKVRLADPKTLVKELKAK